MDGTFGMWPRGYTGSFSKSGCKQGVSVKQVFFGIFVDFRTFYIVKYGHPVVLLNHIIKKKVYWYHPQHGSIFADWIFRVVNFGFHYLRHFSINFENSWAHLAANFLNFSEHPKHFLFGWFLWKLWTKKQKCWRSENMPIWANPEI